MQTSQQIDKYHLKVELKGTHIKYLINNQVVYDGTQDCFTSGYLGLNVWNSNVAFTNTKFTDGTIGAASTITTGAAVTVTTGAAVVAAPVTGETPVSTIDTDEYTATIAWGENPAIFEPNKVYTATIKITPKAGYTLIGVPQDFFTIEGATATNAANSGVITALFPVTN